MQEPFCHTGLLQSWLRSQDLLTLEEYVTRQYRLAWPQMCAGPEAGRVMTHRTLDQTTGADFLKVLCLLSVALMSFRSSIGRSLIRFFIMTCRPIRGQSCPDLSEHCCTDAQRSARSGGHETRPDVLCRLSYETNLPGAAPLIPNICDLAGVQADAPIKCAMSCQSVSSRNTCMQAGKGRVTFASAC